MGTEAKYIILVDDDDDIRAALAEFLRCVGYEVCEARNGAEALDCLRASDRKPAVIVTDLNMPRMSGRELIEALTADSRFASIPRIVISAGEHPASLERLIVSAFLGKPIDLDRLSRHLATLSASAGATAT